MKKFEVEFRRQSYIIVTVEAKSKDEAIDKAWEELDNNYEHGDCEDASWDVESIEEMKDLTMLTMLGLCNDEAAIVMNINFYL